MPIRKYESGIFDTTGVVNEKNQSRHLLAKSVGAFCVASMGLMVGNAIANADTAVVVGGATDSDSGMATNTLISNGNINPNNTNVISISYPAEMGPFVGSTPTNVSVAQGIDAVKSAVYANGDPNTTLYGFSEGDFVTNGAAAQLRSEGFNVNVINAGDGNSATGILSNPLAEAFAPIVSAFGINKTPPVPGTVENLDGQDFWAATANAGIGGMLNDAVNIPTNHRIPGANEVPVQTFSLNDVQYNVYGTPIAVPAGAASDQGTLVPEHLQNPEFFGEAPCVAPDGSQYYTPGDAPC